MAAAPSAEKIVCPKCGFEQYKRSAICKKCGLIFDKWREAQSKKQKAERADRAAEKASAVAPVPQDRTASRRLMLIVLVTIAAVAAFAMWRRSSAITPTPRPASVTPPSPGAAAGDEVEPVGPTVTRRNAARPAPTEGAPAASDLPAPIIDAAYEEYLGGLSEAIDALAGFEQQLRGGVSFEDIKKGFLELRRSASRIDAPDRQYVSYLAVEAALSAYSESLKFWDYRAYSARWQGDLWCAGGACPFETEQGLREAVSDMITACWVQATRLRELASQVAGAGDPLALEQDETLRERVRASESEIGALWERLRRSDRAAAEPPA